MEVLDSDNVQKARYVKRVPFVINSKYNWYKEGVPFLSKMVYITEKDEGLDLREEAPPPYKTLSSSLPLPGLELAVDSQWRNG